MKILHLLDLLYDLIVNLIEKSIQILISLPFGLLAMAIMSLYLKTLRVLFRQAGIVGLCIWGVLVWGSLSCFSALFSPESNKWVIGILGGIDLILLISIALSDD